METTPKSSGSSRRVSKRRKVDEIDVANGKSDEEFCTQYLRPSPDWRTWTHPTSGEAYTLRICRPGNLQEKELDACMSIIKETSGDDYERTSGWHPVEKHSEMRQSDLRYILVEAADGAIRGFTSLQPCFEIGDPIVYCYEIHLKSELRGAGLGQLLMGSLITVAENIPSVGKVMLQCFTSNERARAFYTKMGFVEDSSSPREHNLRGGRGEKAQYMVLSRRVEADT